VTQEQADRLLSVYGDTEVYIAWLKKAIRNHVVEIERLRLEQVRQRGVTDLQTELDGMGL